MNTIQEHFEQYALPNYNLCKVTSRHRLHTKRRINIGLTVENDRLRFNFYQRKKDSLLEDDMSIGRSTIIDLYIDPNTRKIRNKDELKRLYDILNILTSVDEDTIDFAYETYYISLLSKLESDKLGNLTLLNPENKISEESVKFYEAEIEKLKNIYI
jgi:hypothetical protein